MPYEVLARKWRPQQFEDVVGQDHVVRTLQNAIKSGRLAHAYLFVGPRGTGKTSIARLLAKALNCEKGPTVKPCGKCDNCREIAAGASLDVLEIDGASNNTVDQIRDLRDTVRYAPARGRFKIYIIDEVHMLTSSAFNALLKTLEEPPAHVKFLFATTEPDKVLPTIVSRCQRFDLRRIPAKLIVERLGVIARSEKVKVDDDALLAIARGSEGALRDAESALDQLIAFKGDSIHEEDVLSVFGLVARRGVEALAGAILKGDIAGVIGQVAALDDAGKDLQRLAMDLLEHFRNLAVAINVRDAASVLDLTDAQMDTLREQASGTDTARVLRVVEILADVEERMRHTLSKRTLLETALIRASRAAVVVSLEEILAKIEELRGSADTPASAGMSGRPAPQERERSPDPPEAGPPQAEAGEEAGRHDKGEPFLFPEAQSVEDQKGILIARWAEIVEKAGKVCVGARGLLGDLAPGGVEDDEVIIEVDPEFEEDDARLKDARLRKALEHIIGDILRREVVVVFRPGSGMTNIVQEHQAKIEEAGVGETSDAVRRKQKIAEDPVVQETLRIFKGEIIEVRI